MLREWVILFVQRQHRPLAADPPSLCHRHIRTKSHPLTMYQQPRAWQKLFPNEKIIKARDSEFQWPRSIDNANREEKIISIASFCIGCRASAMAWKSIRLLVVVFFHFSTTLIPFHNSLIVSAVCPAWSDSHSTTAKLILSLVDGMRHGRIPLENASESFFRSYSIFSFLHGSISCSAWNDALCNIRTKLVVKQFKGS